jgi:16S rRNA (cytosine967-C5)-methyltransferase
VTPGAQVAAAIEILSAVDSGGRPADETAALYFRRRRYIGAKDRAEIARHLYDVLRHRAALDWWIARVAVDMPAAAARTRALASLVLIAGWPPDRVARCLDGGRFHPAPLSPAEARLLPRLERALGAGFEREIAGLNRPAPVDLRANPLKTDRAAAQRRLAAEGVDAEPTPWSPLGLRLETRAPLAALAAFREGLVEVQDEGSQVAALLADARPGMRVVDFCAGAGGKTLALAAQLRNRGRLVACDVAPHRLERAGRRLRRAGVDNVERRALAGAHDPWVKRHKQSFDRVFVDAPCLGTGTWRRNPDAKWRLQPRDLAELTARQRDILKSAARLVRPGGRLVYATCSLLREENEDQAAAFLAEMPDFAPVPAARVWRETIGGVMPGEGPWLRLTPARHGTDGFFVAIFERRTASFEQERQ